ncbi:MAG: penicillin-binding protein 2 [Bacteroidota bacterium]
MRFNQVDRLERRAKFMTVVAGLCFLVLFGRLWMLQIVQGAVNYRRSIEYTTYDIAIPAPRGVFYDRNGRLLVSNRSSYNVVGLLETLKQHPEVVTNLAKILGCAPEAIGERLATPGVAPYQLYPVAKDIPVKTALHIQERSLDLPGIEVQGVPCRQYLFGDFASHAFGFIREISHSELAKLGSSGYQLGDMIGKSGLERTLEQYLRGEDGVRRIEIDKTQRPVRVIYERAPVPGYDAWLTLNYDVQKAAEEALRKRLTYLQRYTKQRKARAGAVIALDPRNGEILAMASQPSFDPNVFVGTVPTKTYAALNNNPDKPFNNRVLRGLYPPASTFKPFTVLAALQEGITDPKELFRCTGFDRVYGSLAKCWIASQGRGHGALNVIGGLKNSCNVVMYELARRLGVEKLADYARLFRFGQSTGVDLEPGDAAGIVPDPAYKKRLRPNDPWRELETLHFAIGQGYLEVTPLQLCVAYAGLANGGHFYRPHLVKEIRTVEGQAVRSFAERRELARVKMSEDTRRLVLEGLNEVISGGTAAGAFAGFPLDRFPVAGKTGTGQKKGYDDFALFACFAPADKPRIAVVVVVEQGGGGSTAAAPVAREVLEAFFHVPPSKPQPPRPSGAPSTSGLTPSTNTADSPAEPGQTTPAAEAPSQENGSETPPEQH